MQKVTIDPANLQALEKLKEDSEGSVYLKAVDISYDTLALMMSRLEEFGKAVYGLELAYTGSEEARCYDMVGFNFAKACVNLVELRLKCCEVGGSLLKHPVLKNLKLEECWWHTANVVEIGVNSTSALEEIDLLDTNWSNNVDGGISKLSIGSLSLLRHFKYSLDEDFIEAYATEITLDSCPFLESIRIDIDSDWKLSLKGDLPKLQSYSFSSGRYGSHHLDFSQVGELSAASLVEIRDGEGSFKDMVYVFLGKNKHFQQNKVRHIITVYGGSISEQVDDRVTHAVLLGDASYEWDSEELIDDNLVRLKELLDAGNDVELIMDNEAIEHFEDWY